VAPSCSGTGTDGKRVQVLYVHESHTASRYAQVLPLIRNEVANVDDVFAVSSDQTGGGRRVRWVTDTSCVPVVANVTVPDGALGPEFFDTITALENKGYQSKDRKYVVFADANQFCGIGTLYTDAKPAGNLNDGYAASYSRIDANCWATNHSVAAHELTHNLGGVQTGAPHVTKFGHCWDESDLMCYEDGSGIPMRQVCAAAQEQLLDCRHDDYFSTDPAPGSWLATHWNTASSGFLDTVTPLSATPRVSVRSSVAAARTGETVTLTATSTHPVSWTWSTPSGCALTPSGTSTATAATAGLVCPAAVTGPVAVTATGSATDGATGRGAATVSLTRAAAPTAPVTAPGTAVLGEGFAVSVAPTGVAPFRYSWSAGPCSPADPSAGATTVTCPAGVTPQFLPVTATVTQADGQTATSTSYVAVGDAEHPAPPRTASGWTTPAGTQGRLSATLRSTSTSNGVAVAGQPVVLEAQWYGTTGWVPVATLTTDGTGTAATSWAVTRAGSFRFTWRGDATRDGSVSPATYLKVATRVSGTAARTSVAATLQTVAGTRLGGAPVTLQKRTAGTTRWVTVTTLRTTTRGTAAATVRPRRTTYYRWVFAGEAQHVSALSPQVVVRR
jgi:hypothetical protein